MEVLFFSDQNLYGRVGAHDVANMALNSMYNDGFFMFILYYLYVRHSFGYNVVRSQVLDRILKDFTKTMPIKCLTSADDVSKGVANKYT